MPMPLDRLFELYERRARQRLAEAMASPETVYIRVHATTRLPHWRWPRVIHTTDEAEARASCRPDERVLVAVDGQIVAELGPAPSPISAELYARSRAGAHK